MSSRHFVPAFALASLSLLLGATPVRSATAATIQVTNCNDTGANSLRDAVARAASGDTVSMTLLACNRISLSHGPIVIAQNDLTLRGRDRTVTLHGRDTTQVLRHTGTGTLTIQGLVIAHGHNEGLQALGGCVYTAGNLDVRYSRIHHCVASGVGEDNVAAGGAVYVQRNALLSGSVLDDNAVTFDGPASTRCVAAVAVPTLVGGSPPSIATSYATPHPGMAAASARTR